MTEYNGTDIYCDLIIPRDMDVKVVKETAHVLAFYHSKPHWPVHIVVVPKQHIASLLELSNEHNHLARELLDVLQEVSAKVNDAEGSCRVLTNLGDYQDSKHLHFHVNSGEVLK
jgi:histidine triad (HIT) family protein